MPTTSSRRWLRVAACLTWLWLPSLARASTTLQCDEFPCGNRRVQMCHFNGREFMTLCIRQNSVLRKPDNHHTTEQDYCGPCTHRKAFETTDELRQAVKQYSSHTHYNVDLASTYGWPMSQWNVSLLDDFSQVFSNHPLAADEDLSGWDVSRATSMALMFWQCPHWEGRGLEQWNTANVQTMERMFFGAQKFNANLNQWNTARVTNMMGLFWKATAYNQPLNQWDTTQVVDVSRMFADAHAFDQDLSSWNTQQFRDTSYMFLHATSFSKDLSSWKLDNIAQMERMFHKVPAFQVGTVRQDTLWKSWTQQWARQGRSLDTINTQEIFNPKQHHHQVTEVVTAATPSSSTASYMRGNAALLRPIRIHKSRNGIQNDTGAVEVNVMEQEASAANNATSKDALQAKCVAGICTNK
ncbi:(LipO)protein [Seminavis robusta]|uniref:(LipO)protein n=1 Tax=Seminavis robusta TaxID=568900 RepID=A0A9N8H4U0_9STRA|nr:(LipO)protein [Seminavis robusta]|eukprot:Sro123_g059620.1 (LipO)protein (411) ;mRNA; r:73056-74288